MNLRLYPNWQDQITFSTDDPQPQILAEAGRPCRLFASGWVHLPGSCDAPVEVRREMPILSSDGVTMGTVAAVMVEEATQQATHLLLGRPHPDLEYRLVPLTLIERLDEAGVRLRIPSPEVNQLPRRAMA